MPLIALSKIRQFKHITLLQHYRLARRHDPLSAPQRKNHRTALILLHDILKQDWTVLILKRRFLNSTRFYTAYISRTEVVDKLLSALTAYEQVLTYQAAESQRVRYDLAEFERNLFAAIYELHLQGSRGVVRQVVGRPVKGWECLSEYQSWRENRRLLVDRSYGKVRIREWEAVEVGRLMDGEVTVDSFDGEGGFLHGVEKLRDVLPRELVERFDPKAEGYGEVGNLEGYDDEDEDEELEETEETRESDDSDQGSLYSPSQEKKAKPAPVAPQGRSKPTPKIKLTRPSNEDLKAKAGVGNTASTAHNGVSQEERPMVILRLKVPSSFKMESESSKVELGDSEDKDSEDLMFCDE